MTLPARTPSTRADGPLDVLRVDVAAADDDDVLDAAADDQLAVDQVGEVAGAEPAVAEQLGRGLGAAVVARASPTCPRISSSPTWRSGRTSPVEVSTMRISRPGTGCAQEGQATGAGAGRDRPAWPGAGARASRRRRCRSTRPRMGGGNEPPMASSAMPKAGKTAPGRKPCGARLGDEGLDGVGVDRLGAVEGDAQARQVEVLHPLAAHGWPAPTRSSARRWPCRR